MTRGASGSATMYAGASPASTVASPNGLAPPQYTVTLLALKRNNTVTDYFSDAYLTSYSLGTDLTAADVTSYRNAMAAFHGALNRHSL